MKGSWKNDVSGWNGKDSKRKKQTHNNRLRDNGRVIIRKYDSYRNKLTASKDVFRNETETEIVTKGDYNTDKPIVYVADIKSVFVTWKVVDEDDNYILDYREKCTLPFTQVTYWRDHYKKECSRIVNVYQDLNLGKGYYVEGTTKRLSEFFKLSKNQSNSIVTTDCKKIQRSITLPKEMVDKAIARKNAIHINNREKDGNFLYNKPLPAWKRNTFWDDGKRRKNAQKMANRIARARCKTWIYNADWDAPIKNHALEKSIAWEIW